MSTTELPASLGAELRALGWFALPEDEARAALTWKRRCEDRDERIERLCRAVAGLRVEVARARAEGAREALTAAADELHALWIDGAPGVAGIEGAVRWLRARTAGVATAPTEPAEPAEDCGTCGTSMEYSDVCPWLDCPHKPAAPSGVAPADTTEEPADG